MLRVSAGAHKEFALGRVAVAQMLQDRPSRMRVCLTGGVRARSKWLACGDLGADWVQWCRAVIREDATEGSSLLPEAERRIPLS